MSISGASAAALFAKALSSKTGVEATKNLAKSQIAINANQESGAYDALTEAMQSMGNTAINAIPLKIALEQFNASTMEARLNLMTETLQLLNNPQTQEAMGAAGALFSDIVNFVADLVEQVDKLAAALPDILSAIDEFLSGGPGGDTENWWANFKERINAGLGREVFDT